MTVAHVRTFIAVMWGFINVPVFRPSVWPWVTFPMRLTYTFFFWWFTNGHPILINPHMQPDKEPHPYSSGIDPFGLATFAQLIHPYGVPPELNMAWIAKLLFFPDTLP